MRFQIGVLARFGRQRGIEVFQFLCGDEPDLCGQHKRKLRIQRLQLVQRAGNGGVDGADGRLQIRGRAVGGRDDLFPVPLIDIHRVEVIHLLVAADGVHIRIQPLAGGEPVLVQRHPLPFGERMHHLRGAAGLLQIEGNGALDAVEVVVEAGGRLHKQRRRHALEVERGAELLLKIPFQAADGGLRLVQIEKRLIAVRDHGFAHHQSSFRS